MYNEEAGEDDYTSIKHVQVKDTLTVNHNLIDEDSIRRHEMDRGSDIEYERRLSFKRQKATADEGGNSAARDQLFIRDGSTEILRLITRGNLDNSNENLYINVPQNNMSNNNNNGKNPQYVLVEGTGKEILMRRFIEEQANGKQIIREHYQVIPNASFVQSLPNEVQESAAEKKEAEKQKKMNLVESEMAQATSHQSLVIQQELENSLKQQNALLRQILLEKERLEEKYKEHENALETQSLPCHSHSLNAAAQTQTDCEIAVQTEPWTIEMMNGSKNSLFRRRTRSENDDSASEDEYEYVRYSPANSPNGIYWIKRRRHRKKSKGSKDQMPGPRKVVTVESVKRKIRTPIQEEMEERVKRRGGGNNSQVNRETRASNLRRAKIANDRHRMVQEKLYYDMNESMDEGEIVPNIKTKTQKTIKYYIEDSDGSENEVVMHKNYYSADSLDADYEMDDRLNDDEKRRMTESVPPTPAIRRGIIKDDKSKRKFKSFEIEYETTPCKQGKSQGSRPQMVDRQKTYNKLTYEMPNTKGVPRYMEWYSKTSKDEESPRAQPPPKAKRKSKESQEPKPEPMPRNTPSKEAARLLKEDLEMAKKVESRTQLPDPLSHPLLQHSEHRYEHEYSPQPTIPKPPNKLPHYLYPHTPPTHNTDQKVSIKYKPDTAAINENEVSKTTTTIKIPIEQNGFSNPNITTTSTTITKMMNANNVQHSQQQQHQSHYEDDHDSGIAMNSLLHGKRNKLAEKKSVFTIAYDDVQIKRIQMNENDDLSPIDRR